MAETRKCSTSLMQSFLRRALTVSVAAVCLAVLGTLAVPAAVAAINQASLDASAQTLDVSPYAASTTAKVAVEAAARDEFTIVEYTLVQWPVGADVPISSGFGNRSCEGCSSFHTGVDFTPGAGTPVEAIADGVVVSSPVADGSWGVHVTIEHNVDGVIFTSSYAHMQTGSMNLSMGDTVTRGQVLGLVGSTGQSNGAHLHFVIRDAGGTFINPQPWMQAHVNIAD
jgi:murein DD-endopeptidase MepM/ murein hydrolase activator NlpD